VFPGTTQSAISTKMPVNNTQPQGATETSAINAVLNSRTAASNETVQSTNDLQTPSLPPESNSSTAATAMGGTASNYSTSTGKGGLPATDTDSKKQQVSILHTHRSAIYWEV